MTNDKLPEEITQAIKTEANKIYWQTHKISKERDPYCFGLTMFEVAQVPLIEALTEKAIKFNDLQVQAQRMADALELVYKDGAGSQYTIDAVNKALQQFKDEGKGVKPDKEIEYMPILSAELRELKNIPDVPMWVPMNLLNEQQAGSNHGQTLARLKERGGLSVKESLSLINCKPWMYYKNLPIKDAVALLNELITNPTK